MLFVSCSHPRGQNATISTPSKGFGGIAVPGLSVTNVSGLYLFFPNVRSTGTSPAAAFRVHPPRFKPFRAGLVQ